MLEDSLKPSRLCRVSGRNGGQFNDNGEIVDQLAGVQDFMLAKATYEAALKRWPKDRIRLCQEARIVEDSAER